MSSFRRVKRLFVVYWLRKRRRWTLCVLFSEMFLVHVCERTADHSQRNNNKRSVIWKTSGMERKHRTRKPTGRIFFRDKRDETSYLLSFKICDQYDIEKYKTCNIIRGIFPHNVVVNVVVILLKRILIIVDIIIFFISLSIYPIILILN